VESLTTFTGGDHTVKLTPAEMRCLERLGASTRRSDPGLYRALRRGTFAGYHWSVWRRIYVGSSIAMLALAFVAGASIVSTVTWLCLVSLGSRLIRAQDWAGDVSTLQPSAQRSWRQ
jgi:hypothetical protein